MKWLACVLAVLFLSMMGCGGSLGEKFADSSEDLPAKFGDCPSYKNVTIEQLTDAELKQCEHSFDTCVESDKRTLETSIDCVNNLATCTAATEESFNSSFASCLAPLDSVSDACGAGCAKSMRGYILTVCDRMAGAAKGFSAKVRDCPSFADYQPPTDSDIKECKSKLGTCSESDKKALEAYAGCVNNLATCTAATEQAFFNSFRSCIDHVSKVSDSCRVVNSDSVPRQVLNYSKAP